MTDNDIIKALEQCINEDEGNHERPCKGCPLLEDECCSNTLRKQTFDLINRQRGELLKKRFKIGKLLKELNQVQDYYEIQKAEIERLKEENKSIRYCYEQAKSYNDTLAESCEKNCKKFNMTTRAEAIKEFAEELKTRIKNAIFCCYDLRFKNHLQELLNIIVAKIDNLVKEMTEGGESDAE